MAIGTSDGQHYDNPLDLYLGSQENSYHNELAMNPPKPTAGMDYSQPFENSPLHREYERREDNLKDIRPENKEDSEQPGPHKYYTPGKEQQTYIDREHHVPLVASAIMDDEGKMSGMAIDHRVPANPEYEQFLALHEGSELPHMKNLIDAGMKPTEAYHEAHDKIATPIETAAVRAHAARSGQDPDQYLDAYKKFWREAASVASEPSDRDRHPRAHTTVYGLDEGEGAYKVAMAGEGDEPTLLTGEPPNRTETTPEGSAHDKGIEQPFAMTRMLGGSRGSPVMPAANDNKNLQIDTPEPDIMSGPFSRESKLKYLEQMEKTNPGLVNYARALNKQEASQDVKNRRSQIRLVNPNEVKPKSSADQLRDWFRPK